MTLFWLNIMSALWQSLYVVDPGPWAPAWMHAALAFGNIGCACLLYRPVVRR